MHEALKAIIMLPTTELGSTVAYNTILCKRFQLIIIVYVHTCTFALVLEKNIIKYGTYWIKERKKKCIRFKSALKTFVKDNPLSYQNIMVSYILKINGNHHDFLNDKKKLNLW